MEIIKGFGGESEIRTHGRVTPTHAFQACALIFLGGTPTIALRNFQITVYF